MKRFAFFWLGLMLFVMPFALLWSFLPTRDLFAAQVLGRRMLPPVPPWTLPEMQEDSAESLASRFPGDARVAAKAAEEAASREVSSVKVLPRPTPKPRVLPPGVPGIASWPTTTTTSLYERRPKLMANKYRALIENFPREAWLYANFLRASFNWMRDERVGGDFSNPYLPAYQAAKMASPEDSGVAPNFSSGELEAALQIARRGQELEPRNAYFGWCEASLLWAGRRDAQALAALHRASLRPDYDDHALDDSAAQLFVAEQTRPLLWEEKVEVLSRGGDYSDYSRMRERARQLSWHGVKLERANRFREDISLRADLARLTSKMMRGRNSMMSGLVGAAVQAIMWAGKNRRVNIRNLPVAKRSNFGLVSRMASGKFAAYASSHGEPAIARETLLLGAQTGAFRMSTRSITMRGGVYGAPISLAVQVRGLWWLGCALLAGVAACFASWSLLSLFLIRARGESGSLWRVLGAALPGALLTCVLLLIGRDVTQFDPFVFSWSSSQVPTNLVIVSLFAVPFALFGVPALLCGLPVWWALNRERQARRAPESAHLPRDMRPLVWRYFVWNTILACVGGWTCALVGFIMPSLVVNIPPFGNLRSDSLLAFGLIAGSIGTVLWFVGWIVAWRFFRRHDERPRAHAALRRFRAALGVLLVLLAWSYALTVWSSLAPRTLADARLHAFTAHGELAEQ